MPKGALVEVVADHVVLNDPDHHAFHAKVGDQVFVAAGWYAQSLIDSELVRLVTDNVPASEIAALRESEDLLAEMARLVERAQAQAESDTPSDVTVEATERPQETPEAPKAASIGEELPGRISEQAALTQKRNGGHPKRAGSKM